MKRLLLLAVLVSATLSSFAQNRDKIPTPQNLEQGYPRIYITQGEKAELEQTIASQKWAKDVVAAIHNRIDKYVEQHTSDSEWMPSRLLMNWNTKTKDVYIKGMFFSHDGGDVAPVATVKFAGARDGTTNYGTPSIEDTMPYMDDPRGVYFPNKATGEFEWVHPSKTGVTIAKMNERIVALARDAAFIYWLEGDVKYAKFAYDVFDVYMQGMAYRSNPIDLDNGHIQTLVGFTCFQVIHETNLKYVSELYDFLNTYIKKNHKSNMAGYESTIKSWADQIILNGVPQNNWNLHQANIILKAAMVLQDDKFYADKKGRDYYIDYMLNVTSARQWSLKKLLDYGYDPSNGVWAECPGYSFGVTNDTMRFIEDFSTSFDFDLLPYLPVMYKAVDVLPQYLLPNGQVISFGDSSYRPISTNAMRSMIRMAQRAGDSEAEAKYTAMYRLFEPNADKVGEIKGGTDIYSLFQSKPVELNPDYKAGVLENYITQTFHAPTVSWFIQRMGDGKDGLAASLNASLGNHMHANGISLELYGKGVVQGADPGKGTSYFQPAYLEYYSQFPAHNTVMVDGVSSYTEMMSYHGFELNSEYPKAGAKAGYYHNLTYADVSFVEPETQSDQNRTFAIVRNGATSGYYVDIFRSKRRNGKDKFHDYYYHNLGQTMQIMDAAGVEMELREEEKIGFAGGHLYALDYMWGEKFAQTSDDYQVQWEIDYHGKQDNIYMNLWMKGSEGREIFSIYSPPCKGFLDVSEFPYDMNKEPYLTFIARQYGEAWEHPFISVYEPSTSSQGRTISSITGFDDENGDKSFAGVKVVNNSGREDFILSSSGGAKAKYQDKQSDATYSVIAITSDNKFEMLLGEGTSLSFANGAIETQEVGSVFVQLSGTMLYIHNDVPAKVTINGFTKEYESGDLRSFDLVGNK
ncbi:MAG: hypothetical protein SNJ33_01120 [Rikenellaceae bacterium]